MAQPLTDRQTEELHKSIITYVSSQNLSHAAATLRTELGLGEDVFDTEKSKKYKGLLEKKWTSVVRLQRKLLDLESKHATLKTELDNSSISSQSRRNQDPANWIPKAPPRYVLESHQKPVTCVAFHPVFSSLASGSEDYTIKIWDWELGELERTIKGHTKTVLDVDFGGRGSTLLASCSSDLSIKLWDPSDDYKNTRTLLGHDHIVSSVRFVPQTTGNLLVSASKDCSLKVWDVNTGYCVKTLLGHTDWPRALCPSPDGCYILSTGSDKSARLWDISSSEPKCKQALYGHENFNLCCAIAPIASYPHLARLAGLEKPPPATSSAEFMATGSRDKDIRLWDARGNCIRTLSGHDNWVQGLAFHPGGRFLISVGDDRTMRCWDLSQEAKCVQTITGVYEGFVSCVRWGPNVASKMVNDVDGETLGRKNDMSPSSQIRCVVATGSVDGTEGKVRIFAG